VLLRAKAGHQARWRHRMPPSRMRQFGAIKRPLSVEYFEVCRRAAQQWLTLFLRRLTLESSCQFYSNLAFPRFILRKRSQLLNYGEALILYCYQLMSRLEKT
jgi:hypothetical protein